MPVFYGTDINDVVTPEQGYDYLYGGRGGDNLGSYVGGPNYWDGGEDDDYLWADWGSPAYGNFYGGDGNDGIEGGSTDDTETMEGGAGDDLVLGGPPFGLVGTDIIYGGSGRDALYGYGGNDVIYGGDDNDGGSNITVLGTSAIPGLFGGLGDDYLDGGRGNDFMDGGDGNDVLLGGTGNDFLIGGDNDDLIITSAPTTASDGFSVAAGGNGADTIHALGNDFAYGGFGSDALIASGAYGVQFYGEGDNDTLIGSRVADILDGGDGVDGLSGGFGNDVYVGGLGADHFVMNSDIRPGDFDIIADFAGDFIAMPTAYFGFVGAVDTASGVFIYVPTGNTVWGALVTNTHDVAGVYASIYYAG